MICVYAYVYTYALGLDELIKWWDSNQHDNKDALLSLRLKELNIP